MFGEEMVGFWNLTGLGMAIFLLLVGAGLNVYFRGKGTYYVNLSEKNIQDLEESKT